MAPLIAANAESATADAATENVQDEVVAAANAERAELVAEATEATSEVRGEVVASASVQRAVVAEVRDEMSNGVGPRIL